MVWDGVDAVVFVRKPREQSRLVAHRVGPVHRPLEADENVGAQHVIQRTPVQRLVDLIERMGRNLAFRTDDHAQIGHNKLKPKVIQDIDKSQDCISNFGPIT